MIGRHRTREMWACHAGVMQGWCVAVAERVCYSGALKRVTRLMLDGGTTDPIMRLLAWYGAMGVDAAVGADAIDWSAHGQTRPGAAFVLPQRAERQAPAPTLRGGAAPVVPAAPRVPADVPRERFKPALAQPGATLAPPSRTFVATSPDAAVMEARALAPTAATLDALGEMLAAFDGCGLKATAKSLCFYRGAAQARLMVIGEAPGREEDLAGTPFVGPAGALLDKMLAAIGLTDAACHISHAVYWRPPGNRTPTPQEMDVCRPFLERQVALVRPDIVLLLGAAAAQHLLMADESIMRLRGKWRDVDFGGHSVRVIATLHPTYLLRTPAAKQQAWRDLLAVKAALAS
jgi:uracil-DNA glycosylase